MHLLRGFSNSIQVPSIWERETQVIIAFLWGTAVRHAERDALFEQEKGFIEATCKLFVGNKDTLKRSPWLNAKDAEQECYVCALNTISRWLESGRARGVPLRVELKRKLTDTLIRLNRRAIDDKERTDNSLDEVVGLHGDEPAPILCRAHTKQCLKELREQGLSHRERTFHTDCGCKAIIGLPGIPQSLKPTATINPYILDDMGRLDVAFWCGIIAGHPGGEVTAITRWINRYMTKKASQRAAQKKTLRAYEAEDGGSVEAAGLKHAQPPTLEKPAVCLFSEDAKQWAESIGSLISWVRLRGNTMVAIKKAS